MKLAHDGWCRLIGAVMAALLFACPMTHAADDAADAITRALSTARPDLKFDAPRPSAIAGFYEVQVHGGPVLYVSGDATHFIAGDLFEIRPDGFANLGEIARQQERVKLIAAVDPADMIIFVSEHPRATLTVFTDIDCGYCRKLHAEIKEINALGIAVHYLAYPRAGVGSPSYRKIASAWCAKDRRAALTTLKNGGSIPENVCADNPVADEILLGEKIGVTGTPALVLEDGTLVPGYVPAAQLAHMLGLQ